MGVRDGTVVHDLPGEDKHHSHALISFYFRIRLSAYLINIYQSFFIITEDLKKLLTYKTVLTHTYTY